MNRDLTEGRVAPVLIRFAIPLLLSMVFQQLYNIADSLVAGKFISESALAAVGNSYEITLIFIAFAFGCNMGTSILVSQFFGAKRIADVKTAITTSYVATFVLVVLLTIGGILGTDGLLTLINTPDEIMTDSALYLDIYIYGLIFLFFYNLATGVFSALGDSRTPFLFLAFSSTANIFLDILFVTAFGMGVDGVAWATFLCQGVSCILANAVLYRRIATLTKGIARAKIFDRKIFFKLVYLAVPSILQQSFVSVGNIMEEVVSLSDKIRRVSENAAGKAGDCTAQQLRICTFLQKCGGSVSQKEIEKFTGLRRPTVSFLVDSLVTRGLAVRNTSLSDRRMRTVTLTPQGDEVVRKCAAQLKDIYRIIGVSISSEELGLFSAVVEKLDKILELASVKVTI